MTDGKLTGIDLAAIRISDPNEEIGVTDVLSTVRVTKPNRQTYFRVNSDPSFIIDTRLLMYEADRQWYFVSPELWPEIASELSAVRLVTCIDCFGEVFLWPIKLPTSEYINSWTQSALDAVDEAAGKWVRLISERSQQKYRIQIAVSRTEEPSWPKVSFSELINTAFADFMITDKDHPALKLLRGQE